MTRTTSAPSGVICACSSDLVDGASLYSGMKDALRAGWAATIETALGTAVALKL